MSTLKSETEIVMPKILTTKQMGTAEKNSENYGISLFKLMDNAALALCQEITKTAYKNNLKNILILVGSGNNGGDGLVCANTLISNSLNVKIILAQGNPKSELAKEAMSNLDKRVEMVPLKDSDPIIKWADIIIDAVFGTGFHGELPDEIITLFNSVNQSEALKIACDLPSGINSMNGLVSNGTLKCDFTVCFHALKLGLLLSPANGFCGEIITRDIGIPTQAEPTDFEIVKLDKELVKSLLPPRPDNAHKGTFGKLLCVCGCSEYRGAAAISTSSALRTGVGLVNLCSVEDVISTMSSNIFEATYTKLDSDENGYISCENAEKIIALSNQANAVLLGCGLGKNAHTISLVKEIVERTKIPIIIDADGINCLCENINILKNTKAKVVLTPHPAEFSRLLGVSVSEFLKNRFDLIKQFSDEYNVTVLSKSTQSIAVSPYCEKIYLSSIANSALSKGGSGDLLAGMIASFAAQGCDPVSACAIGQFILGYSADILSKRMSKRAVIARDILDILPFVLKEIED